MSANAENHAPPRPALPSEVFRVQMLRLRKRRGLTQRQLAEQVSALGVEISQPAIALIETGKTKDVSLNVAVGIAAALNVLPEVLYREQLAWEELQIAYQEQGPPEQRPREELLTPDSVWLENWKRGRARAAPQKEGE